MSAAVYRYTARAADGSPVTGSMEAESRDAALASLRSRALFVTSLDDGRGRLARLRRPLAFGPPRSTAGVAFYRSFAILIRCGVSVQRALVVAIERCDDKRFREALRAVLTEVETGSALSVALARRPREFGALQIALVRAGEAGGVLDVVLERTATLLEKERAVRKRVQGALAYPAVVLASAGVLVAFLMLKIVPMFSDLFARVHAELPVPTRVLLAASGALQRPAVRLGVPLACLAAGLGIARLARTPRGAVMVDRLRLGVPYVGGLLRKAITARIARTLGALLRSGVPLLVALDVVAPVAGSARFAAVLGAVHGALRSGELLSVPLGRAKLFDPLFVALVSVGEESGAVDEMLTRVADYFDADVDAAVATLGAVVEPLLVILLGAVVGFIVLSVFLPLYALIGSVDR